MSEITPFIESGTPAFDYTALDTEARIITKQRTGEIRALVARTTQDIIEIGHKLIEVKGVLDHGQFGGWLRSEFEWSESAALRMMQVATAFKSVKLTDLSVGPSALYMLAAPSTPEEARAEALSRAEAGEPITHKTAKAIVETHKAAASAPAPPVCAELNFCPTCGESHDEWIDDLSSGTAGIACDRCDYFIPNTTPAPTPAPQESGFEKVCREGERAHTQKTENRADVSPSTRYEAPTIDPQYQVVSQITTRAQEIARQVFPREVTDAYRAALAEAFRELRITIP
jgi:hypothetical protein